MEATVDDLKNVLCRYENGSDLKIVFKKHENFSRIQYYHNIDDFNISENLDTEKKCLVITIS